VARAFRKKIKFSSCIPSR